MVSYGNLMKGDRVFVKLSSWKTVSTEPGVVLCKYLDPNIQGVNRYRVLVNLPHLSAVSNLCITMLKRDSWYNPDVTKTPRLHAEGHKYLMGRGLEDFSDCPFGDLNRAEFEFEMYKLLLSKGVSLLPQEVLNYE